MDVTCMSIMDISYKIAKLHVDMAHCVGALCEQVHGWTTAKTSS